MCPTLYEDIEIRTRVQKSWEAVFAVSNKILVDEKRFGFTGMGIIPDPNIHQLLAAIKVISEGLKTVLTEFGEILSCEDTRIILNTLEQVSRMEVVAIALKSNNRALFDKAIEAIDRQAAF